jgi:uncharacterized protein with PIN domain
MAPYRHRCRSAAPDRTLGEVTARERRSPRRLIGRAGAATHFPLLWPARVRQFLDTLAFKLVGIGERELDLAADAYTRFGRGRHPAALNMGDCFAYACARANQTPLLFKGDDFGRTDSETARA